MPFPIQKFTKRNIFQNFASIYDAFRFMSPSTLKAKEIFCNICDDKMP